jgi:hypothetical protein
MYDMAYGSTYWIKGSISFFAKLFKPLLIWDWYDFGLAERSETKQYWKLSLCNRYTNRLAKPLGTMLAKTLNL